VSKKLKRYIRSAGLPENLHFHSLRHTFGTWGANAGIPSNVLKEMMGHSSIKTTEVYMGVDSKAMGDQVGKITLPG
jgi:site-specific recombinase XerD